MDNCTIVFKNPNKVIPHEVVFDEPHNRTLNNCFRYVLNAYLYYKDLSLFQFCTTLNYNSNYVARQLGNGNVKTRRISYDLAIKVCEFFQIDFILIQSVAQVFQRQSNYNALCFSTSNTVNLFNAVKADFRINKEHTYDYA